MRMYNPPHPGEVLKELYLQPMGLSVTETAGALGVSRKTLSAILNGRARVTPEMALRLARALDGTAATWINLQAQRDLWDAEQAHPDLHVRPLMSHKNGGRAHRSAV